MVSGCDDAGQARWAKAEGITVLRGSERLDGPGRVRVGDQVHTAGDTVIATGSEPVVPPVPSLRELEGVWTNREATGVNEVPCRVLVLGGGDVGPRARPGAGAHARVGGNRGGCRPSAGPASPRRWATPWPRRCGRTASTSISATTPPTHGARATTTCSSSPTAQSCAVTRLLVAIGRRPGVAGLGLETVGLDGIEVDARMHVADGVWAIGDVTGTWPLTYAIAR
jgi:pyruvate/2-oxoglutarate dehydrogenase complex dihydrolipoamide dehydrogenase (E3) component